MDNSDVSHEGHRKRLLDTVIKAGLENLSEIQIVELWVIDFEEILWLWLNTLAFCQNNSVAFYILNS